MNDVMASLTTEQKSEVLHQVLGSQTFARSDKLKSFLKLVCEMEIAGRGAEINEYLIGVEALGRPEDYSPGEDSSVRNRAYALRQKLLEFYTHEQPNAGVRIELPKGAYCPHFVAVEQAAKPGKNGAEVSTALSTLTTAPAAFPNSLPSSPAFVGRGNRGLFLGFLAGVLLTATVAALIYSVFSARTRPAAGAAVLREVWGPLLAPEANVLVCLATPMHLVVRPYPSQPPPNLGISEAAPWMYDYYRRHRLAPAEKLYLLPTTNSPYWGDAAGALAVTNALAAAGVGFQLLPERVAPVTSMRGRNVVLFGSPFYSEAVARLLQNGAFQPGYDPDVREPVIFNRQPRAGEPAFWTIKRDEQRRAAEVYGLITVLPSEGASDGRQRTVIISGLNSAGTQAAAEFFASPSSLLDLQRRVRAEGPGPFPTAWQVIVKTTSDATLPLSYSYVTHRVLSR
ncbi:MAG: hypothetical protein ACREEM_05290 [Blastocatellia bacterium]